MTNIWSKKSKKIFKGQIYSRPSIITVIYKHDEIYTPSLQNVGKYSLLSI
jgi:hypothetical protein